MWERKVRPRATTFVAKLMDLIRLKSSLLVHFLWFANESKRAMYLRLCPEIPTLSGTNNFVGCKGEPQIFKQGDNELEGSSTARKSSNKCNKNCIRYLFLQIHSRAIGSWSKMYGLERLPIDSLLSW